jgi:hypothetical protein
MFNNLNFFKWYILDKFLMQALSKYYNFLKYFLWNILKIKQSKKQSQRGGCGSCYPICSLKWEGG